MRTIFIVLDGACDKKEDKKTTPLEKAYKPNLDYLSKNSQIGQMIPIKEGFDPETSDSLVRFFGVKGISRGYIEAVGAGLNLGVRDIAFRANFATLKNGVIVDRRAGRNITREEAEKLSKAINSINFRKKFVFKPTIEHRGVVVFKNTINEDIVGEFCREVNKILNNHPVNILRRKNGKKEANTLILRGAGRKKAVKKRFKNWIAVVYMPVEIGIAKIIGMKIKKVVFPEFKGKDIYLDFNKRLEMAINFAKKELKKNKEKNFYIHFKEFDVAGHDGRFDDKVKMIELIDKKFFSYVRRLKDRIIVTCDHATSCSLMNHTNSPVPIIVHEYGKKDNMEFTEENSAKGSLGNIYGEDVFSFLI